MCCEIQTFITLIIHTWKQNYLSQGEHFDHEFIDELNVKTNTVCDQTFSPILPNRSFFFFFLVSVKYVSIGLKLIYNSGTDHGMVQFAKCGGT